MRTSCSQRVTLVYLATNRINGRRYVGITCRRLCERRSKHFWSALKDNSQTYFHRSIRKLGRDSFEFEVLRVFATYEEAAQYEIKLIADIAPEYNQSKGGDGYLGYSPSDEQRRRISERLRGRPGPWKGKRLPESVMAGRKRWNGSKEGKKSWAACGRLGPQSIQRPVLCLDDGLVHASVRLAAQFYDIDASLLSAVCKRRKYRHTAGGRTFEFAEGAAA